MGDGRKVAKLAKGFGGSRRSAETLGEFRYNKLQAPVRAKFSRRELLHKVELVKVI